MRTRPRSRGSRGPRTSHRPPCAAPARSAASTPKPEHAYPHRLPARPGPDHPLQPRSAGSSTRTQVFVNTEGDSYRTRPSTHTIEVGPESRGRSPAALGLNEDLTEALGARPRPRPRPVRPRRRGTRSADCMKDHGGFEHNLQGLRIVEKLEVRYPSFRGLNLSYETREGMAKHGDYLKKGSAGAVPSGGSGRSSRRLVADTGGTVSPTNHHDPRRRPELRHRGRARGPANYRTSTAAFARRRRPRRPASRSACASTRSSSN